MALTTFSPNTLAKSSEVNANFTYLQSLITALVPSGSIINYSGKTAPSGWLFCDGSAVSRTSYADLFAAICASVGTFTVTIATPAVVTLTAHGLVTGDSVYLTTTGALPTGLSANTLYYVVKVDANTFNLATSRANAYASTKIATSGTQSGTHTLRFCPYGLGDGSSTFTLPDARGRVIAGNDLMSGTAASRLSLSKTEGAYGNIGSSGGEQGHQLTTAELAAHTHGPGNVYNTSNGGTGGSENALRLNNVTNQNMSIANAGSDSSHNNVQPTLVAQIIIKT